MKNKKHWKEALVKKPTQWLRELPAGEYSLIEISSITGRGLSAIMSRMNLLEIPKRYEYRAKYERVIYKWCGIVDYEKNQIKKIKKNENTKDKVSKGNK